MNLFVSVGTSALREDKLKGADLQFLQHVRQIVEKRRIVSEKQMTSARNPLVRYHASHWSNEQQRFRNLIDTSAELASTFQFVKIERQLEFRPVSNLVLLSSNTDEGRLAAEVNLEVFTKHAKGGLLGPDTKVHLKLVQELDLNFQDIEAGFERSLAEFTRTGERCVFNYTGGFKGAVPTITLLGQKYGWRLYYQHESSFEGYTLDLSVGAPVIGWRSHGRIE